MSSLWWLILMLSFVVVYVVLMVVVYFNFLGYSSRLAVGTTEGSLQLKF